MKRKETLEIEEALMRESKYERKYGCEEITIGFQNNGHGDEIVDFMTMDSKGILRCYEIKITLEDLKSKAKKSWYGHYNYLVVSSELYAQVEKWKEFIPEYVGIIVAYPYSTHDGRFLENKRKCKKLAVSPEIENMLKESIIRSMFYKYQKLKDATNTEHIKYLEKEIRKQKKEKEKYQDELYQIRKQINMFESYKSINDNTDVDFVLLLRDEKKKYEEKTKNE